MHVSFTLKWPECNVNHLRKIGGTTMKWQQQESNFVASRIDLMQGAAF